MGKIQFRQGFPTNAGAAPLSVLNNALESGLKKNIMQLTKDDIEHFIYNTVDIVPEGEDSVFLGTFSLFDAPATLNAILSHVTSYYDTLLQNLPLSIADRLQLQMQRCFTYDEYKCLFNLSIKNFGHYPIFRTLLITSHAERLLFIRNNQRDESYQSYVAFLQSWSKIHNPRLNSLVYEAYN